MFRLNAPDCTCSLVICQTRVSPCVRKPRPCGSAERRSARALWGGWEWPALQQGLQGVAGFCRGSGSRVCHNGLSHHAGKRLQLSAVPSASGCAQPVRIASVRLTPGAVQKPVVGTRGQLRSVSDFQTASFLTADKRSW